MIHCHLRADHLAHALKCYPVGFASCQTHSTLVLFLLVTLLVFLLCHLAYMHFNSAEKSKENYMNLIDWHSAVF